MTDERERPKNTLEAAEVLGQSITRVLWEGSCSRHALARRKTQSLPHWLPIH